MALTPTRPKGPPLNAMRAFEAAARLESFVAAAQELCVTAGAVSQHIKTMEDWAGRPLFQRGAHGVALTEAGRRLLPHFVSAFDAIGAASQTLRHQRPGLEFHIAALPSVAQLWLPFRLGRIRGLMPDLKVSVTAMETGPNLARELFDMALFFEPTAMEGDGASRIEVVRDVIFPVCAPSLAERFAGQNLLTHVPLLHDQTWKGDWETWCAARGVTGIDPHIGPRYSLYSLAVEEAKSGAGILMGHASLIDDALKTGALVRPFEGHCETGLSLMLTLPARPHLDPRAQSFIEMLVA